MSWLVKRDFRRSFGITAYVGANGSGKSFCAVLDTLPSLEAGRRVLSTVRLLDYENPRVCDDPDCVSASHPDHLAAHPLWVPFTDFKDLLDFEGGDVIMDEVTGIASSRASMSLPGPVANLLVQLRRRDVVMRWTAPSWARADSIIRETTQAVVKCRGFFARRVEGRSWPSNRVIMAKLFDARAMDNDLDRVGSVRARAVSTSFIRLESSPCINAYDTLDNVLSLPVIEGGRCVVCGGRRRIPACTCEE